MNKEHPCSTELYSQQRQDLNVNDDKCKKKQVIYNFLRDTNALVKFIASYDPWS